MLHNLSDNVKFNIDIYEFKRGPLLLISSHTSMSPLHADFKTVLLFTVRPPST